MTTRSLHVRFKVDSFDDGDPEIHTIDIADGSSDAPAVLENPHVDFPGTWRRVQDEDGVAVYELAAQVAETSDTVEIDGAPHATPIEPTRSEVPVAASVPLRDEQSESPGMASSGIARNAAEFDRESSTMQHGAPGLDGDQAVLLEDVGENGGNGSVQVSDREIRAQHDAGKQDGGTGR